MGLWVFVNFYLKQCLRPLGYSAPPLPPIVCVLGVHLKALGAAKLGGDTLQGLGEAGLLSDDGQGSGLFSGADPVGGLQPIDATVLHGDVLDEEGVNLPDAITGNLSGASEKYVVCENNVWSLINHEMSGYLEALSN